MQSTTLRQSAPAATSSAMYASSRRIGVLLWTLQVVLAVLFLVAGSMKLVMPIEAMTKQMPLPGAFLRFIGVAEICGALGLILPGLFRIRRELTPLAAVGLVVIMIGATSLTLVSGSVAQALFPLFVGVLCATIAYGRGARVSILAESAPSVSPRLASAIGARLGLTGA